MLKRYLEATEASPAEIEVGTFQNLIRVDVVQRKTLAPVRGFF